MINFFRKIRKQLADDNKPLKYARYAIGEIVLVVVGILIALSINNWNENNKNIEVRRNYYHQILKDLQTRQYQQKLTKKINRRSKQMHEIGICDISEYTSCDSGEFVN